MNITKGTAIQPLYGRRLRDARADSNPYMGKMPGDYEDRLLIRWSHQASDNDRHHCLGALSSFVLAV